MEAIQLNNVMHQQRMPQHRYACRGIEVRPNPPRVGEVTILALALQNTESEPLTLNRIQFRVAAFGMGMNWEQLPAIEGLTLPASIQQEVELRWTPTTGGHRCVRVTIEADTFTQPLHLGRNLNVIESTADRQAWHVPFRLGNPADERQPITLEVGRDHPESVEVHVLVNGQLVQSGMPVWLNAREEVDARLVLHARTEEAIRAVTTIEAHSQGRFIDGIQVEVYRPAFLYRHTWREPESRISAADHAISPLTLMNAL